MQYFRTPCARRGTTLIEVLIYSALLAMFIGATFAFVASILGSTDNLLERNEAVTAAEFIERKFIWLAGQATAIASPAGGTASTSVTFAGANPSLFPATFTWEERTVTLALPGVAATPLTNSRIIVTFFLGEHFAVAGENPLRVTFSVGSVIYPYLIVTSTSYYAIP